MLNHHTSTTAAVLASVILLGSATAALANDTAGPTHPMPPRPDTSGPATLPPPPSNGGPTGLTGAHLPPPPPVDPNAAVDLSAAKDTQVDAAIGLIVLPAVTGLGLTSAGNGPLEASVSYCYPATGVGCGEDGKLTTFENNCKGGLGSGQNDSGPYVSCTLPPHD